MHHLYRICRSRKEAEGLMLAIRDRLGIIDTVILTDEDGNRHSLLYGAYLFPDDSTGALRGDVDVRLRESRVRGKFQLFIRAKHQGHMARVRAALSRRTAKRIEWPARTA